MEVGRPGGLIFHNWSHVPYKRYFIPDPIEGTSERGAICETERRILSDVKSDDSLILTSSLQSHKKQTVVSRLQKSK